MRCRRPRNGDCRPPTSHLFHEAALPQRYPWLQPRPPATYDDCKASARPLWSLVLDVEAAEAAAAWVAAKCAEAVQVEALALEEAVAAAAALAGAWAATEPISSMERARHTACNASQPTLEMRGLSCMYSFRRRGRTPAQRSAS